MGICICRKGCHLGADNHLSNREDTVLFLAATSVEEAVLAADGELSRGPAGVRSSSLLSGRGEGSAHAMC